MNPHEIDIAMTVAIIMIFALVIGNPFKKEKPHGKKGDEITCSGFVICKEIGGKFQALQRVAWIERAHEGIDVSPLGLSSYIDWTPARWIDYREPTTFAQRAVIRIEQWLNPPA